MAFTHENARRMQLNGAAARKFRCRLRYRMLRDNAARIEELFSEALAEGDPAKLKMAADAGAFLGMDFRASADYVQKSEVREESRVESRVITFTETGGGSEAAPGAETAAG